MFATSAKTAANNCLGNSSLGVVTIHFLGEEYFHSPIAQRRSRDASDVDVIHTAFGAEIIHEVLDESTVL
jgi:hypothetical protein